MAKDAELCVYEAWGTEACVSEACDSEPCVSGSADAETFVSEAGDAKPCILEAGNAEPCVLGVNICGVDDLETSSVEPCDLMAGWLLDLVAQIAAELDLVAREVA